jgi:diaminohydroxyphosphoribosylaminopyrimidine deaminase/5-amino-6-(5-phosphoribosylamino)uracil reductase
VSDADWLDAAVALAEPHLGTTAENPTVGAIILDGVCARLGQAVTAPGGRPHAETRAIAEAGETARGATLYVTLEPCNHWGKTPPCSDAIVAAGLARVVIGVLDADPRTAGQSVEKMRAAGITVAVLEHRGSARLHEGFLTRQRLGRPFVTAKLAVSADGMIGRLREPNVPITGEIARNFTHLQRATSDAIMVGGSTANIDNPRLSVRLDGYEDRKPLRVVLAGKEPLFPDLNLFAKESGQPTAVIGLAHRPPPDGVTFLPVPGKHFAELPDVLKVLGDHGINRLLVEGGSALTGALLNDRLVDRFLLLESPEKIGPEGQPALVRRSIEEGIADAGLVQVDQRKLGADNLRTFERA